MQATQKFTIQSLLITLILNAVLLVVLYVMAGDAVPPAALFGVGAVITLVLWFAIRFVGKRFIESAASAAPAELPKAPATIPASTAPPPAPAHPYETSAVQILSILQRKGRLIDFLQEDLSLYDDAQIGAAVRTIHDGCKQALAEHVRLEPIYTEAEGAPVTIEPGFDAQAIRLTGNIVGDPPFKGALRHRGWRVADVDLPERMPGRETTMVLAAAEVEVQ